MRPTLHKRPDAATYAIEDLVPLAHKGAIRVPAFQRIFRWEAKEIQELFDSIYRGFPMGTLLFWKKPAEAGPFSLGPLDFEAPKQTEALWIVDGQQRITSLVGVLAPPGEQIADFKLYFDLSWEDVSEKDKRMTPFCFAGARKLPEPDWLPMSVVLDSENLDEWLDHYGQRSSHPEHVRRARRLNKLVREYKIPAYIVEADDTETLGLIFDRVNNSGKRLQKSEVFTALFRGSGEGYSLPEMAKRIRDVGFGELSQELLLKVVLATHGLDITSASKQQLNEVREIGNIESAIDAGETALRKAIAFSQRDARIPHGALLPYEFPLIVLARFFHLHPDPRPRSRALLARWVWRGAITGEHRAERIPIVRAILKGLSLEKSTNEEEAVQALLDSVPRIRPAHALRPFRFGSAQSKLELLALSALGPRNLVEGDALDAGLLLSEHGTRAIVPLPHGDEDPPGATARTLANVLMHPPIGKHVLLGALATATPLLLAGHGINAEAGEALRHDDWKRAIEIRHVELGSYVERFLDAHARWDETDRPSLASLMGDIAESEAE